MTDQRRLSKQVMERQRRARINSSLDRLKELLRRNRRVDADRLQRLEKADILELTVEMLLGGGDDGGGGGGCCAAQSAAAADSHSADPESSSGAVSSIPFSTPPPSLASSSDEDSCQSLGSAFHPCGLRLQLQRCQLPPCAETAEGDGSAGEWRRRPLGAVENKMRPLGTVENKMRSQPQQLAVWRPW